MFNLFFALLTALTAYAQANEPGEVTLQPIEIERVDKTVRASETKSVISSQELELKHSQSLADALRNVEGITVMNSGGPNRQSSVFIRGSNADHVLVLIDGVEMNDLLSPARTASLDQIFAGEIERIEILRGPQTLRFGPSALNGVINVITKKGSGAPKRLVKAELGKYNSVDGMVGFTGGEPDSNYDIRYSQFQTSGFSAADENLGNHEADASRQSQISGRFTAAPQKNLNLDLSLRYIDSFAENDLGGGANQDDPDFYTDTRKLLTSLQSHSAFDNEFIQLDNLVSLQRFDRVSENKPDLNNPASLLEDYHGQLLKLSTNTSLNWSKYQTSNIGIDFKEDRGRSNQFSTQSNQLVGAFVSHTYSTNHGLFFDLGARIDEQIKSHDDDFTTQNGLGFAFSQDTRLRLGVGTSIKQPSLYQLYSVFGDPKLHTEKGRSGEISLEHSFADGWGRLSSALFYNHFEDLIDFQSTRYVNFGRAESSGAEFAAKTPLGPGVLVGATYTLLRARSLDTSLPLLRRPNESASVEFQLNVTPSVQFVHSTNFVGVRDDVDATGNRTSLPSHFVSRLVANYDVSKVSKIYVRIENLYDRSYEEVAGYGTSRRAGYLGFSSEF